MAKLKGNIQLTDLRGQPLNSLTAINRLSDSEKLKLYAPLFPPRLLELLGITADSLPAAVDKGIIKIIAPSGLGLARLEARTDPEQSDTVFFAELADTQFHQMELSFCIICDPSAPRFDVDVTEDGAVNWFATHGRNIPEEIRAFEAGLFPNQTRRGLKMFGEFFPRLEQFTDALGMEMIVAEPLTYDNAIRYEKYGFDYLTGKRLMLAIQQGFMPNGSLLRKMDGSSCFRQPGMEQTVRGRSWAIHDGILDEPWDGVQIYKMIGVHAGLDTFPDRKQEELQWNSRP